jgi:hypothetical protein
MAECTLLQDFSSPPARNPYRFVRNDNVFC